MKTIEEQMKSMITIPCKCGFNLGIREFDMDEIAAGVWGRIRCPQCHERLNPLIKEINEKLSR